MAATKWGKTNEAVALEKYKQHQHAVGHDSVHYCQSGFVICKDHPYLGASPDALVYDPSSKDPFGLAEVKCPYSYRYMTLTQACSNKTFFVN